MGIASYPDISGVSLQRSRSAGLITIYMSIIQVIFATRIMGIITIPDTITVSPAFVLSIDPM